MNTTKTSLIALGLAGVLAIGGGLTRNPAQAADEVTIGSGSRTGPFYSFGRKLCRLLKRHAGDLACSVLPTPKGDAAESYANLINVRNGTVDIVLARSDWLHFAVTGTGRLKHVRENFKPLRSLFSIHSQAFTLVARADAKIASLDDLKGKRINLGIPYSEARATMELVMAAKNWTKGDFVLVEELSQDEQSLALCHDRVQAVYYVTAHPDRGVERILRLCNGVLVDVSGPSIEELVAKNPYLSITRLPGGLYPGADKPVKTFGASVTLVSSADVDEELVYAFVKAVFDNLDDFKKSHPALSGLDPARMVKEGLAAPLHAGAERYYREQGLM